MSRFIWIALGLLTACEQTTTMVDPGSLCFADNTTAFMGPAEVRVGEPLPLMVTTGISCDASQVTSECMVDIVDNEAIVSSVFEFTTPGRFPGRGQDLSACFRSIACETPPAAEGMTVVRYGTGIMAATAPGTGRNCIEAEVWTPQE